MAAVAAVAAVTALNACGGGGAGDVAVRVGDSTIAKATVAHWMAATAGGRAVARSAGQQYQQLHRQVLGFLISSHWVFGEAAEQRLKVSDREVEQGLKQKVRASYPGGESELRQFLKDTGQSLSDVKFEIQAQLAEQKMRQRLAEEEAPITQSQVASYYDGHRQSFAIAERRGLEITNRKSAAKAEKVKQEVLAGRSFASTKVKRYTAERSLEPNGGFRKDALEREALERAIYSAKPGVLTGPVRLRLDYFLFKVTHIMPGRQKPLAEVQGTIRKQLAAQQQRATLAAFIVRWRRKWIAKTDCHAGYVVQKCSQYRGTKAPEDPVAFE
jgi:foldase protein PrsA